HDDGKPAGIAQPLKVSTIAREPAFAADLPADPPGSGGALAVERLDSGACCCVYPWALEVPAVDEPLAPQVDAALMFEIHAACQRGADSPPAARSGQHETGVGAGSREEIQLEELATRLSSEILATASLERSRQSALRVAELDRLSLESAAPATPSAVATKIVQILVPTHPVVRVSTRTVCLPRSYGADAALVEVGVRYDAEPAAFALHSIAMQCPEWRVQSLGAPSPLLLPLTTGTSYSAVFKLSSLVRPADSAPVYSLQLLNDTGSVDARAPTPTLAPARSAELTVLVHIVPIGSEDPESEPLVVKYRTQLLGPSCGGAATAAVDTVASSTATPAGSLPSARSKRSSDVGETAREAAWGHAKTASLDYDAHARTRKYSLTHPPTRPSDQRPRASSKRLPLAAPDGGLASAQRSRAATVNVAGLAPHPISGAHTHGARNSTSTLQSTSTVSCGPTAARGSVEMDCAAVQQQQQQWLQRHQHHSPGAAPLRETAGELGVAFEAPPRALLGEQVAVRVCLSNSTTTPFSCLSLVDDSAADDCSSGDAGLLDGPDGCGLLAVDGATAIPPLRPGGSVSVTLKYVAAAPHFHAAGPLRLLSLDGGTTLAVFDAPFVVFVDDSR
ncbi:hypothetical protein IWQ57_001530, partial [Coemansia nantahalensis]